ncbi:MAG: hypothetical protein AB8H86_20645, partial [Polyangiales bacterium]
MGGTSATLRKYYRRFARRAATTCYGLVAGGLGVLLSFVVLQKLGLVTNENVVLGGLAVAALGLVSALPTSAFLVWAQRRRTSAGAVGQEVALGGSVQGVVTSGTSALVCTDGPSFELDGLRPEEVRRLQEKHTSATHFFESGPPARARLWWLSLAACGVLSSAALAVLGYTIDHLMPLAVYTSVFVASASVLGVQARDVRIGIDGVRMGLEFVSYSSLQQLTTARGRLVVVCRDGRRILGSLQVTQELGEALDALVQPRLDAAASGGEAYDVQNEESFDEWLKRVRGRFDVTSFREAPASVESAKELLRDAKVPFRVRVGVAVALAPID